MEAMRVQVEEETERRGRGNCSQDIIYERRIHFSKEKKKKGS